MKFNIGGNLRCEVDRKKDDCHQEAPHCHITRNGIRVAQVWLNPVSLQPGHSLDRREISMVINEVSSNRNALEGEYLHNKLHGAD